MPNLNSVMLMGNITRDIEVRYTPKGKAVAEIGLAINRAWKNDAGEKQEEVTFVDVTLWGRTAEVVSEYCKKGSPIFIQGRLSLDQWDDKETGKKRQKLKVIGETIQLIANKGQGSASDERSKREAPASRQRPQPEPELEGEPDDVPFYP